MPLITQDCMNTEAWKKLHSGREPQIFSVTRDDSGTITEIQIISPVEEDHPTLVTVKFLSRNSISVSAEGYD